MDNFVDEEPEEEVIKLIVQLERVVTTKDGGSKITFTCGTESLIGIQKIQTLNARGDISLALALVPYRGM